MKTDLTGLQYGRWNVVSFAFARKPHQYYHCRCQCGTERVVQANSLKTASSVSCGCYRKEAVSEANGTHRMCGHPAYQSWSGMKRRCQDPKLLNYKEYGARGISVCETWQTFEGFWADMGPSWAPGLTIERNDNDGNYELGNCRWATMLEQAQNKRNSRLLDTPWGAITQSEAARRSGITAQIISSRRRAGWPPEALLLPPSNRWSRQRRSPE